MKKINITTADGSEKVNADIIAGVLAIHHKSRWPGSVSDGTHTLTHLPTGRAIIQGIRDRDILALIALEFLEYADDNIFQSDESLARLCVPTDFKKYVLYLWDNEPEDFPTLHEWQHEADDDKD